MRLWSMLMNDRKNIQTTPTKVRQTILPSFYLTACSIGFNACKNQMISAQLKAANLTLAKERNSSYNENFLLMM